MKKIATSILLILMTAKLLGQKLPYLNPNLDPDTRAKDLLSRMSIQEKVGQLSTLFGWEMYQKDPIRHEITVTDKLKMAIDSLKIGMLWGTLRADPWTQKTLETGLDPKTAVEATNKIQSYAIKHSRWGIPLLLSEEAAHGLMAIGSTVFPTSIGQASTWNDSLIKQMGEIIAEEIRALGSHVAYGPILDLAREPRWSRVEETYGEDPYLVGQMGISFVKGLQGNGRFETNSDPSKSHVISTLKHFVAYGIPSGGHNGSYVSIGSRELAMSYLPPFEKAIKQAGALSIMTAYNSIDGIPCTANKYLLTDVLRSEWGFKGFVVSDLGSISGLKSTHHIADSYSMAAGLALDAGVDNDLGGYGYGKNLMEAINSKQASITQLDSAVFHCLRLKFQLGLFENPYRSIRDTSLIRTQKHILLNRQIAKESIILLKRTILPLKNTIRSLAVIGPNADNMYNQLGDYTAPQKVSSVITVLEGIKSR